MLIRRDAEGVIAIGQASHAWLSGQLARAWSPRPAEEVCLAAEQHDVGMAEWDLAPRLHPDGRPVSFMEMELEEHLRLWSRAPDKLVTQSIYAGLLVSMHGCALYERRDLSRLSGEDAEAVRGYLSAERARQDRLIGLLRADRTEVERDQRLVFAWDAMSLALCLGWEDYEVEHVGVTVSPSGDDGIVVDPWPFGLSALTVHCEGRRLADGAALDDAPRVELRFELVPA